jgi:hypothetical protein
MQAKQRLDNLQTERAADGYTEKYKFRRRASVTRRYNSSSFHQMLEWILHPLQRG